TGSGGPVCASRSSITSAQGWRETVGRAILGTPSDLSHAPTPGGTRDRSDPSTSPTSATSPTEQFRAARDVLLANAEDYDAACAQFVWPQPAEFNWALDWFDAIARDNDDPALWIVEQDGSEAKWSFAELSRRSHQVANW